MPQRIYRLCCFLLVTSLYQPQTAVSQWFPERSEECGAHICLETGKSNWRSAASKYCEEGVCLRDRLENLVSLRWNRMTAGQDSLTNTEANPFIGLTSKDYQTLRALDDTDATEQVQLLGKVSVSCQPGEFSIGLSVPGRNSAKVTFGTPLASDGGYQAFQVVRVERLYRITTGRTGSWLRWIHNRFPGIVRMEGPPSEFANYEMGLYVGNVVLFDKEYRSGQPADYAKHPDCAAR